MRASLYPALRSIAIALTCGWILLTTGCRRDVEPPRSQAGGSAAMQRYIDGLRAAQAGRTDDAKAAFVDATEANPNLIMARSYLGDLYREEKDYRNAASQYQALTKLDPYSANNFYRLGVSLQLIPQLQEAAAAYLDALKLEPKEWKANMNLGLVYMSLGRKLDALRYARRAVALNPNDGVVYANLGVTLEANNQSAEAAAAYRRAIELDPKRSATYLNLAANLISQRKPQEAISVMTRAIRQQDSAAARTRYGEALAAAGRHEEALKQFQNALKLNPRFYPAINRIGDDYIRQYRKSFQLDEPKREAAVAQWTRSLRIEPDQPKIQALVRAWTR